MVFNTKQSNGQTNNVKWKWIYAEEEQTKHDKLLKRIYSSITQFVCAKT